MIRRGFLIAATLLLGSLIAGPGAAQSPVPDNILVIQLGGAGVGEGTVEIELLPQIAPQHVERIKTLARAGAYDDVAFHRVIAGFMAQTGDVKYGKRDVLSEGRAGFGGSDLPDVSEEFSDENCSLLCISLNNCPIARSRLANVAWRWSRRTFDCIYATNVIRFLLRSVICKRVFWTLRKERPKQYCPA